MILKKITIFSLFMLFSLGHSTVTQSAQVTPAITNVASTFNFGPLGKFALIVAPLGIVGAMSSLEEKWDDKPFLSDVAKALSMISVLACFNILYSNSNVLKTTINDSVKVGIIFVLSQLANNEYIIKAIANPIWSNIGHLFLTKEEQKESKSCVSFGAIARNVLPFFIIQKALEKYYFGSLD